MKAGVVSDTHGNVLNLKRAVEWLIRVEDVDLLIHLGDDASDLMELKGLKIGLISVPGVFEGAYSDEKTPNRIIREFDGVRVLITHTPVSHDRDLPGDVKPEDVIQKAAVDVVLHGHSHAAAIEKKGGVCVMNPGHLKSSDSRGGEPAFGVLDFSLRQAKIISLADKRAVLRGEF